MENARTAVLLAVCLIGAAVEPISAQQGMKNSIIYKDYYCVAKCLGLIQQKQNCGAPTTVAPATTTVVAKQPQAAPVIKKASFVAAPLLNFGPPLKCSTLSFVGMRSCCSSSPRNFIFSDSDLDYCHGGTAGKVPISLTNAVWEYVLNQAQGDKPEPSDLDLSKPRALRMFRPAVCFVECLFKREGLSFEDNWRIDFKKLAKTFSASVSVEWRRIVEEAILDCAGAINVSNPPTSIVLQEGSPKTKCHTQPFLLLQCLRKSVLLSCPGPNVRDESSSFCQLSDQNLRFCDSFKF